MAVPDTGLRLDALLQGQQEQITLVMQRLYPFPGSSQKILQSSDLLPLIEQSAQPAADTDNPPVELVEQLAREGKLSETQYYALKLNSLSLSELTTSDILAAELAQALWQFQALFLWQTLTEPDWIQKPAQPLATLITTLCHYGVGWEPSARGRDKLKQTFLQIVSNCASSTDSSVHQQATQSLQQLMADDNKRTSRLEQRLIKAETGSLKAGHARQTVAKMLNRQLAGKLLPPEVDSFIKHAWRDSLILYLLSSNAENSSWNEKLSVSAKLIDSFQTDHEQDSGNSQFLNNISDLRQLLQQHTISLEKSPDVLDQHLATIEQIHIRKLKGEPVTLQAVEPMDQDKPLQQASMRVSNSLIQQIVDIPLARWFLVQRGEQQLRCKLILKLDDFQQLLFCNQLGMKALQLNYEEFAYQLSAKTIRPLVLTPEPHNSHDQLLKRLYQHFNKTVFTAAEPEPAAQTVASTSTSTTTATTTTTTTTTTVTATSTPTASKPKSKTAGITTLQTIATGTRFAIEDKGKQHLCTLAVKLASSDQYIFCDPQGVKQFVFSEQELQQKLDDGSATITAQKPVDKDPLSSLVDSLRQQHNQGGDHNE